MSNKQFEENQLLTTFTKAVRVFDNLKIKYWLEFGTLLGAYRDQKFLSNEHDLDFGMFMEDFTPSLIDEFRKNGIKLKRQYEVLEERKGLQLAFGCKDLCFDIFFFQKDENDMFCFDFLPEEGMSLRKTYNTRGGLRCRKLTFTRQNIVPFQFYNIQTYAPEDIPLHLSAHYGSDFMTPKPKWDYTREAENATAYKTGELTVRYKRFQLF